MCLLFSKYLIFSSVAVRITSVYDEFRAILFPYVESNPDLQVMIAPPQFSLSPSWYSTNIGLATQLLRTSLLDQSPFQNLHLLPAQTTQVFYYSLITPIVSRLGCIY